MNAILSLIRKSLRSQADPSAAMLDKRYHKYDYKSLGLGAKQFHAIMRELRSEIDTLSIANAKLVAAELASTHVEEETQAANFVLSRHVKQFAETDFAFISKYTKELCSWSQVDAFASMVMQSLILRHPEAVIKLLRKWNMAKSLWQQRLSVVVFTRKTTSTSQFTEIALELCENLMESEDDLIRKAIGWVLKDTMRGNKTRVLEYVKQLRRRGISATVTLYAIRDLKGKEREEVLKVVKQ